MCINFLGMMHRDTHTFGSEGQDRVGETQFTQVKVVWLIITWYRLISIMLYEYEYVHIDCASR